MSKIVDIDERSFKEKVKWKIYKVKCRAKLELRIVYHWVKEHPTQTMIIVTTAVGAISEVRRTGDRIAKIADDRRSRLTVYCNDIQGRVRLKHELNYSENLELRDRMNNGQTKFEALSEMNLLK